MDQLFLDLNKGTDRSALDSVHLSDFPLCDDSQIDTDLEERMNLAQSVSSMVLGLRRKVNIKVRQPLAKIMLPALDPHFVEQMQAISDIVKSEINVKEIEFLDDASGILVKKIKPNFKLLGKKHGKMMKQVAAAINAFTQEDIATIEKDGLITLSLELKSPQPPSPKPQATKPPTHTEVKLQLDEVEILSQDIPGWLVANEGSLTVALDITVTEALKQEGIAREFINRIQNLRKDSGFEVTDKITVAIREEENINEALKNYADHIGNQTLAVEVKLVDQIDDAEAREVELDEGVKTLILIKKI